MRLPHVLQVLAILALGGAIAAIVPNPPVAATVTGQNCPSDPNVVVHGCVSHSPRTVRKMVDSDFISTSYASADLTWQVTAGQQVAFLCHLTFRSAAPTTGFGISVIGPAAPALIEYVTTYQVLLNTGIASNGTLVSRHDVTYDAMSAITTTIASNVDLAAEVSGSLINGPNAGAMAIRLKTEIAGSAITLRAGSWCTYF